MHVYPHYSFQLARCSNLAVAGTAGEGYILFTAQATDSTTPAAGAVKLFSDSTVSGIARLSMRTSSGAILTFFRDTVDTVRNSSGGAFTKGQVVYKNGSDGITASIALAKADVAATAGAVGVILAPTFANNTFGTIQTGGRFQGINTVAFSSGDALYLSPTTAGAVTNVRPSSPNIDIKVGTVITSSANGVVDLTFQPYVPVPDEGANDILTHQVFNRPVFAPYLTGPITALGGRTTITSQTGTGTKFVMDTSPTLVTPNIGTPSAGVVTNLTGTASININGTVGAATPTTVAATTLSTTGVITVGTSDATAVLRAGGANTHLSIQSVGADGNVYIQRGSGASTVGIASATGLAITGAVSATTTVKTGGYTVGTLPAGTAGMKAYVTDALAPAFLTTLVGGGAAYSGAQYSGAAWVAD